MFVVLEMCQSVSFLFLAINRKIKRLRIIQENKKMLQYFSLLLLLLTSTSITSFEFKIKYTQNNNNNNPSSLPTIIPSLQSSKVPSLSPVRMSKRFYSSKTSLSFPKYFSKQQSNSPTLFPTLQPTELFHIDNICQLPLLSSLFSSLNCNNITNYDYDSTIQLFPHTESNCGCLESSSPYSFTITKRDPSRVILLFQGGGLCWDENSFKKKRCRQQALPILSDGILSSNPDNVFSDYTVISILYCSGDLFLGNSTSNYFDSTGNIVKYNGVQNVLFILDWIEHQQNIFYSLNLKFDHLVIAGSSAGSIGAQVWSDYIISRFQANSYTVLIDSMFTFMPSDLMYNLYDIWNFCSTTILIPEKLQSRCLTNPVSLSHIMLMNEILQKNSAIPFIYIQSKWDSTIIKVYNWLLDSFDPKSNPITENDYVNLLLDDYTQLNYQPNLIVYFIESFHHLYLYVPEYYTTNQYGEHGLINNSSLGLPLYSWIKSIQYSSSKISNTLIQSISSECILSNCSNLLFPKTFKIITPV